MNESQQLKQDINQLIGDILNIVGAKRVTVAPLLDTLVTKSFALGCNNAIDSLEKKFKKEKDEDEQ